MAPLRPPLADARSVPSAQRAQHRARGNGSRHANIGITLDRYGHLMPGNEAEFAELFDTYMERANTAARVAQIDTISS